MNASVRLKLFGISLVLVVGVGLLSGLYLERQLRSWLMDRIELELLSQARLARDLLETAPELADAGAADALADRMGSSTGLRITIVDDGGKMLGDSSLDAADLAKAQSHRDRPEIDQALQHGQGTASRHSSSVHTDMFYIALPFRGVQVAGVVRAAMRLTEVDAAARRLRWVLFVAGLLGMVLAVGSSGLASHLALRPLRSLVRNARQVTSGADGGAKRLPVSSNDELGRLAGSFNELVDELDQTLSSLAGERDRLETILGGVTEALLALDPDDKVTHVNRAAIDLLELSRPPAGQSLLELVGVPALGELMERVHGQSSAVVESELSLPHGRTVLARAASIKSTGGTILVMLDISEMRRLEKVRRDFVANVSHELRTPVSVIQANAETLLDGALTHPLRGPEFTSAILRNAQRLSRLISDLLDLSRIESGHFALELQPTVVSSAVQRAVEPLSELAQRKRLTVHTHIAAELAVLADSSALDQVLTNLIDNAVKYTPEDGHVEIRATRAPQLQSGSAGLIHIDVCDDGAGIEPRHRQRIFERFYRVDPGRSREMGGTGLGLAIVKHLVGAMHGEVGVTDNPTGGSLFRVTLPAA